MIYLYIAGGLFVAFILFALSFLLGARYALKMVTRMHAQAAKQAFSKAAKGGADDKWE